jgi:hypothetical protein
MNMKFPKCKVKSVKANIATGEIGISFVMNFNAASLEAAEALSQYVDVDRGKVEVQVIPDQLPLQATLGMAPEEAHVSAEIAQEEESEK